MRFSQITQLPQVGDDIFINDKDSMRPATVIFSEKDGYIEFASTGCSPSQPKSSTFINGFRTDKYNSGIATPGYVSREEWLLTF